MRQSWAEKLEAAADFKHGENIRKRDAFG